VEESRESLLEARRYLWQYFEIHSEQRLKTFNFFLIMAAVTTTGYIAVVKESMPSCLGMALGLMLVFLSFLFWQLDRRNKDLIGHAEKGLMHLEAKIPVPISGSDGFVLKIFSCEESQTRAKKEQRRTLGLRWYPTYSRCFNLVFVTIGIMGIAAIVFCIFRCVIRQEPTP
jgi:hypothetical protein